jgi:hypothetical protein
LAALGIVIVLVLAGVGGGFYASRYFQQRANPGATLAGKGIAGQDQAQVTALARSMTESLRLRLSEGGKTVTATPAELGLTAQPDQAAQAALAAGRDKPFWLALNPWSAKPVDLAASVDAAKLQDFLDTTFVPPEDKFVNADVKLNDQAGVFEVVPGKVGETIEAEPVMKAIQVALAGGDPGVVQLAAADQPPVIADQAAQQAVDKANAVLAATMTFTTDNRKANQNEYTLPAGAAKAWTAVKPNAAGDGFDVVIDQAAATKDIADQLDQNLAVPPRPQIVVLYPGTEDEIGVKQWGWDGLKVAGTDGVGSQVVAALEKGESPTIAVDLEDAEFTTERVEAPSNFDVPDGDPWIDVNLSTFRVTLFKGTTAVNSFLVTTGDSATGHGTRTGTNYVYMKYDSQVMRGTDADPYEVATQWVSYFDGGIAFHSAPWREPNDWGREASHGCVNMRTSHALALYNFAPVGTKVVVHR